MKTAAAEFFREFIARAEWGRKGGMSFEIGSILAATDAGCMEEKKVSQQFPRKRKKRRDEGQQAAPKNAMSTPGNRHGNHNIFERNAYVGEKKCRLPLRLPRKRRRDVGSGNGPKPRETT